MDRHKFLPGMVLHCVHNDPTKRRSLGACVRRHRFHNSNLELSKFLCNDIEIIKYKWCGRGLTWISSRASTLFHKWCWTKTSINGTWWIHHNIKQLNFTLNGVDVLQSNQNRLHIGQSHHDLFSRNWMAIGTVPLSRYEWNKNWITNSFIDAVRAVNQCISVTLKIFIIRIFFSFQFWKKKTDTNRNNNVRCIIWASTAAVFDIISEWTTVWLQLIAEIVLGQWIVR